LISLGVLSWVYATFGEVGSVQGFFFGLKAAVLAVVLEAVLRVGRRALRSKAMLNIAGLAFVGLFLFGIPFPLVIATAAIVGFIGNATGRFDVSQASHPAGEHRVQQQRHRRQSMRRSLGKFPST